MSKATYGERVEPYIFNLPHETKSRLLLNVALIVFGDETGAAPGRLAAFDEVKKLLADFAPELHEPFDRDGLTTALGDYLIEWWGESLDRPLSGKDLDHLLDILPDTGVREALKKAALATEIKDDRE